MAGPGLNLVRSLARDGSMKVRFLTYSDAKRRASVHARPRMAGPGLNLVRSLARGGSMKVRLLNYGKATRRASGHARPGITRTNAEWGKRESERSNTGRGP